MHPRTQELLRHIEENRQLVREALEAAPLALRERRPAPERWSVAEVLEHLSIVELQVAKLLKRGLRIAQAEQPLPADPDVSPVLPTVDGPALVDRERALGAPEGGMPRKGLSAGEAWRALEESRAELREVLLAADGLATRSIVAPHPFFGELNFHQWIAFVGFHEARHAAQIRATVAAVSGQR